MKCPSCQHSLQNQSYESILIDQCQNCGGTWLDDGEIVAIIQDTSTQFSKQQKFEAHAKKGQSHRQSSLSCPVCSTTMNLVNYLYNSGMFIDRCPSGHGIWLDAGELEKIQILQEEAQGLTRPIAPQKDKLRCCPRDGSVLTEISYENEKIDQCPRCAGVWCDEGELYRIIENPQTVFSSKDFPEIQAREQDAHVSGNLTRELTCVVCDNSMLPVNFSYSSGILIDRCPLNHGVWFDRHEMERIQIFVERWRASKGNIAARYEQLLTKAREEADQAFRKAEREGYKSVLRKSILLKWFSNNS